MKEDTAARDPGYPLMTRERLHEAEERRLAPYACRSSASRGRRVVESRDPFRTEFQRDRDRIIHTAAFRRLNGKTQVFISDAGDHFRTRLTHSLEVSQIARSISRSLGLNEDLTEALALAHDLGHTPFGHSGGDVLDQLMKDHGGFEHNRQGLRIVDLLEVRYPGHRGLNLSYEVRESIIKHRRPYDGPEYAPYRPEAGPLLEAQVVDLADGIAYNSHDLDDGLRSGILVREEVEEVPLWAEARARAERRHGRLSGEMLHMKIIAELINIQIGDLVTHTHRRLQEQGIEGVDGVLRAEAPLIGFSVPMAASDAGLRRFLKERFYLHYRVNRMRYRAQVIISRLFEAFSRRPELMPPRYQELISSEGRERAIADYVAGMTDSFAEREYRTLFLDVDRGRLP